MTAEGKAPSEVCDICGSRKAIVHLTQIENNQMSTSHLCKKCAAAKGVEGPGEAATLPLSNFLAQLGDEPGSKPSAATAEACSFCGLAFADFREAGRLGCPHCYTAFEDYLRGLLRRVHGSTQHVGKVYLPPDPSASDVQKQLELLRYKLQRAVDCEDFERAAELRDRIRMMEPAGS